jgi:signal transduction histidine kinase
MLTAAWRLPIGTMLPWSLAIGLLMSTEFLFQPFVWRNWPIDEVVMGWLELARDSLIVAVSIGLTLWVCAPLPARSTGARAVLLAMAIVLGASAGQLMLIGIDSFSAAQGLPSLVARVLRWSVIAASAAGIYFLWRHSLDAGTAAAAAELRRVQIERQAVQTRLQALRSQIEPHFLFNTLATVRRLHHTEPTGGAQLLGDFLTYLRLALPARPDRRSSLGDELDLVKAYLGVVAVRLSGRLQVQWDVADSALGAKFPPLMLATLVENAIKHGIAPAADGGRIHISARRDADIVEVTVADTGVGFSAGATGSGIGLTNIRARLQALYGNSGRLSMHANQPNGVRAHVRLPYQACEAIT